MTFTITLGAVLLPTLVSIAAVIWALIPRPVSGDVLGLDQFVNTGLRLVAALVVSIMAWILWVFLS